MKWAVSFMLRALYPRYPFNNNYNIHFVVKQYEKICNDKSCWNSEGAMNAPPGKEKDLCSPVRRRIIYIPGAGLIPDPPFSGPNLSDAANRWEGERGEEFAISNHVAPECESTLSSCRLQEFHYCAVIMRVDHKCLKAVHKYTAAWFSSYLTTTY
jgi:hypothetical protein